MSENKQENSSFQLRWVILAIVVVLSLIFLIPFIQEGGARVDTSVVVETEKAFLGSIQETTDGLAEVTEAESYEVKTEYAGVVADVLVEEGQPVKAGDVIARFDEQALEAQVNALLDELDALEQEIAQSDAGSVLSLTAEQSGLVKAVYAQRGDRSDDVIEAEGGLVELSTDGLLKTELPLTDGLEPEMEVTVQIAGQEEMGEIAQIDEEAQTITVTFPDRPEYGLGETVLVLRNDAELGQGEAASNAPWLLTAESCIISEVAAEPGTWVEAKETLLRGIPEERDESYQALLDRRTEQVELLFQLQEFGEDPVIVAQQDGLIRSLQIETGSEPAAGDRLCEIVSTKCFYAQVRIPEETSEKLERGQSAELVFDGVTYQGRVESVSQTAEETMDLRLCTVQVVLEQAEGLSVGASGSGTIILDSAEDVVLVPAVAVHTKEDGTREVEISYGDGLNRYSSVETGLEDGTYVQILLGVSPGEDVVVSSQVVETTVFNLFGHEWVLEQEEAAVQTEE